MKQLVSEFCNKELKRLICFKEQVKTFSRGVTFLGKRSFFHITTANLFISKFRQYHFNYIVYNVTQDNIPLNVFYFNQ